jgi:hypothetical protein
MTVLFNVLLLLYQKKTLHLPNKAASGALPEAASLEAPILGLSTSAESANGLEGYSKPRKLTRVNPNFMSPFQTVVFGSVEQAVKLTKLSSEEIIDKATNGKDGWSFVDE